MSLLNTDAKILAKILACCLEKVVPTIISIIDQTGFIKDRYSFFNMRGPFNILHGPSPSNHGNNKLILSLDAEKAFDSVEWEYLFRTLETLKFGPKFISWIKIIYSLPMAAVRSNNNISKYFKLQRGTRQGCPLSPLLFTIAIEPLAIALRQSATINGIQRAGLEHKVSLYADDMLLLISDSFSSIPELLISLAKFGSISGYKVNLQKSELMPITSADGTDIGLTPFRISPKILDTWVYGCHVMTKISTRLIINLCYQVSNKI